MEDFGTVAIEDDETFSASVSFDNKGGVTTTPDPGNSGGSNGGGSGGFFGGITEGVRESLPSTGGLVLTVLGAGIVLISSGLLVRRIFR